MPRLILPLLVVAICCHAAFGQSRSGSGDTPLVVVDVELSPQGELQGTVCDATGQPLADKIIFLLAGQQAAAQSISHVDGSFGFTNLRGGNYVCQVSGQHRILRAWKNGTAPPGSRQKLLIADQPGVVRGQQIDDSFIPTQPNGAVDCGPVGCETSTCQGGLGGCDCCGPPNFGNACCGRTKLGLLTVGAVGVAIIYGAIDEDDAS